MGGKHLIVGVSAGIASRGVHRNFNEQVPSALELKTTMEPVKAAVEQAGLQSRNGMGGKHLIVGVSTVIASRGVHRQL